MTPKINSIAVLGDEFSFHHLAAIALFGVNQKFIFNPDFDTMINRLKQGETDYCIIAAENSIAGEVPGNFQRIAGHHLHIHKEIYLRISLCLGVLPGVNMNDIKIIYSHPMGRKECTLFFKSHPQLEFRETNSTATGARIIADEHLMQAGVITSKTAIRNYGLSVLASGIDDHTDNRTRFFVLSRNSSALQTTNKIFKASLLLQFHDNQPASSFDSVLTQAKILMKKELRENELYLEAEFTEISQFHHFLQTIPEKLCTVEVIGIYEAGEIIGEL